ncbi:hypothetical protein [Oryzomonas rubra]|uniref:Uncharacterized protein n=1 Tax=Oryzomonas rubra TaxID=2509454 RepID=A0A5A9XNQ6_9BACT|nr:hypothetical protein [Oryzomonas rubra]KAA0894223.1 hypothetical protein ET418_04515 [Oryzomonas rubra]
MIKQIIALVFSVMCLFAVFLPLAQGGNGLYVNVTHIGGITYLLYLLPVVPAALSLIAIYKGEIRYTKVWMIVIAVVGLCLSGLAVTSGKGQIEYMANAVGNLNNMFNGFPDGGNAIAGQQASVKVSVGLGGILLVIGYLGILLGSLFKSANKEVTAAIVAICLLAVGGVSYGSEKAPAAKIPGDGQMYYGNVPSYYTPPKYHDLAMGYSGNNILGINKTGKNINEWIYSEKFSSLSKISSNVAKSCKDNGYSISVPSNIKIEFDKPLDSVYLITYSYEINCW